jgi:hypothetical protein
MDKFYEDKKRRGLIFTEAHLREGGSNNNVPDTDSPTTPVNPYCRTTGAPQWDREKRRYRTYEEQLAYQKEIESKQSDAALVVKEGHHCYVRRQGYHRRYEESQLIKSGEPKRKRVRARWKDK